MIGGNALTVSTNKADKNLTMENSVKIITDLYSNLEISQLL